MSLRPWFLRLRLISLSLVLLLGLPQLAGAVTLDREGKGPPPSWFTCHKDIDISEASGYVNFQITLQGFCGVHPGDGLPGWTPVEWKQVTVHGRYNYDDGSAEETIWTGPDIMIKSKLQCTKNPWAHGNACSLDGTPTNNTGVNVNWSYPISAQRMSYLQRQVIAKWEEAGPAPTLDDWVPYTTGTAAVKIVEPKLANPIPQGSANFNLEAALIGGSFGPNDRVEFEWNQILPPKDSSIEIAGRWVAYSSIHTPTSVAATDLPTTVATFANRGLYAVRAKMAGSPDNTKTNWRMFWVGEPLPGLEPYAKNDGTTIKATMVSVDDELMVFGKGQAKEMKAAAALQLISGPSKASSPFTRMGNDDTTAPKGLKIRPMANTAAKGLKIRPMPTDAKAKGLKIMPTDRTGAKKMGIRPIEDRKKAPKVSPAASQ
ncbi:MAG: hypothetical protein GY946_19675, partial [bacterium]|nr:hypothetical protein [bacterium]